MHNIDLVQIALLVPKLMEIMTFLSSLIMGLNQYRDLKWSQRPLIHKLLIIGFMGWLWFIILDIFVFLIAGLSITQEIPPSLIMGYSSEYPSLFVANILRDMSILGIGTILFVYIMIPFTLRFGEKKTNQILRNKGFLGGFLALSVILVVGDRVSIESYNQSIIVDAVWTGYAGISILIFILMYIFVTIMILRYFRHPTQAQLSTSYKNQISKLIVGVGFLGLGFVVLFILGIVKSFLPAPFSLPIVRFFVHLAGHSFWIISPLLIQKGTEFPLEEIDPKPSDLYRLGTQKLRNFIDQSFIASFLTQGDHIIYVNARMAEILGYPKQELESWKMEQFLDLIHTEDRNKVISYIDLESHKSDVLRSIVYRIYTKNKKLLWIRQASMIFQIKDQSIMQAIFIDISELKRLKEEIRKSEQRYLHLFEGTRDIIGYFDNRGYILSLNPEAYAILGYSEEEMRGKNARQFLSRNESLENKKIWGEILSKAEKGELFEVSIQKRNGELLLVELRTTFQYDEGILQAILVIARDITIRKRLENQNLQTQKLESIALLAGGIAHDYNNILVAILGNISLLQIQPDLSQEQNELLKDLEHATFRAKDLTNNLLTFTKGGALTQNPESILDIIKESTRFALSGSNCDWKLVVDPALSKNPIVNIDASQISRVVNNIIINASQAMSQGGTISIEVSSIPIHGASALNLDSGDYYVVKIKDQGQGISEEHQKRLFEPYFTTKEQGSGLGLAISYSIMKNHNGTLTFETALGKGSTFSLYFPIYHESAEKIPAFTTSLKPLNLKILLMDDNEHIIQTAGKMLQKLACNVECARNGEEAIQLYEDAFRRGDPFAVVITDLTIPGGMGGKETIQHIWEIDPTVKAIVSSGFSEEMNIANHKDYHFMNFLPKPYTIQELYSILIQIL